MMSTEERLSQYRKEFRQIPHPDFTEAAFKRVEHLYVQGHFGEGDQEPAWLSEKVKSLADALDGAYEDWLVTA